MTETESLQFISEVLKGFWPGWEPTDAQYGLWTKRLKRFLYGKAEEALGEWMVITKRTYKNPPFNMIIQYFQTKGAYDHKGFKADAVIAFEIQSQDNPRDRRPHYESSLEKLKRFSPQEIEHAAERARKEYIDLYGGNWIIIQTWNLHFGELPL